MKKYEISPAAKVALKKTNYTIDDIADPPNNGTKYTRAEVINFIKDMKAMIVEKGLGEFSVSNGPMHEGDSILDELTLDTSEVASHAVDLDEPNTIVETFDPIKPTDIDSDVSWFPITNFITSTQMEEIFTALTLDADFDRMQFTKADGATKLYADCEMYDVSESKAIYHISASGWTISSSVDTDFYVYYQKTAGHNTTYISKSGGTAAQSVYDGNTEFACHGNDATTSTNSLFGTLLTYGSEETGVTDNSLFFGCNF